MSEAMSSTELNGQHVELLPARTVLSVFIPAHHDSGGSEGGAGGRGPSAPGSMVWALFGGYPGATTAGSATATVLSAD